MLTRDGRALEWWTDFEKTVTSFARFDRRDAERLRYWRDAFRPIVQHILILEAQAPPLSPEARLRALAARPEGRLLLETSAYSPREFVQREFRHPLIRASLLFFNGLREVDLRAQGFGHHIPALLASDGKAQMCVGGSANLADGGRAVGVQTVQGETLRAR